jgi:hypothetical protein
MERLAIVGAEPLGHRLIDHGRRELAAAKVAHGGAVYHYDGADGQVDMGWLERHANVPNAPEVMP